MKTKKVKSVKKHVKPRKASKSKSKLKSKPRSENINKGIKAKSISFTCSDPDETYEVESELKYNGIRIGDTGTNMSTRGRDIQVPSSQSKKAAKLIKEHGGCNVVFIRKDIDM